MIKNIFKFLVLSVAAFTSAQFVYAQTASILPPAKTTFFDSNGKPLANGKIDFYIPGTTTRKLTWQDSGETIPNTNPVVLDSAGRAIILGQGDYRQRVTDKNGNIIWDQITSSTGSGSGGSATVGDGDVVGSIKPWPGLIAPSQYVFAYGQELARGSYKEVFDAITNNQNVSCTIGSSTLTGVSNTSQFRSGMPVESSCLNSGTTVLSKTTSTVTVSSNAIISSTVSARFFPYGNGDGINTFNLPDLRGRVIAGLDNMGGIAANRLTSITGLGQSGGIQSQALTQSNLPNVNLNVNIPSGQGSHTHSYQQMTQSATGSTGFQSAPSPSGFGLSISSSTGNTTLPAMTGTAALGGTSTAFSILQPTEIQNYIIKILPDTNPNTFFGVASIGGMYGVIDCGIGITCAGNTISAVSSVTNIAVGSTSVTNANSGNCLSTNSGILSDKDCNSPVITAANFGQADWCANLDAANASLGTGGGTIWVSAAAGNTACSGTGPIVIGPGINLVFIDGATYTQNRNLVIGQGSSITGNGSGNAMGPITGRKGTEFLWTGGSDGSNGQIRFFDVSFAKIHGLILNCNLVANCVNVTYDSDNNPATSFNTITSITFMYAAIALQIGLPPNVAPPTVAACNSNFNQPGCYEMDTLTMREWRIYGAGSTAQGITVNSMNALQMSKIQDGNIQSVNIGVHQIFSNPGGTTWLERVTSGTLSGANSTFYRAEATTPGTFTLMGNETEGGTTYAVWNSSCFTPGANGNVTWISNEWNNNVLVDGCQKIVSIGNRGSSGPGSGDWIVSGTSNVYSIFDNNNGGWQTAGSGVLNNPVTTATAPITWNGFNLECPTCGVTTNPLSQFASTTSLQLRQTISDETGIGNLVFGTSASLVTPNIIGVTNGSSAAAGSVGEIISSSVVSGSAVPLSNNTPANITSITLTPGQWSVTGQAYIFPANTTKTFAQYASISTTSASLNLSPGNFWSDFSDVGITYNGSNFKSGEVSNVQLNVSTNTTVYLVAQSAFNTSTNKAYGQISAIRLR